MTVGVDRQGRTGAESDNPQDEQPPDGSALSPLLRKRGKKKNAGYGSVARAALFWSYLRSFIYSIVAIPTTIILARLLAPADFGIAAAATFFAQMATKLSSGGMGAALIRVKVLGEDHVSSVFLFSVVKSFVIFAMLVAAAPAIGAFYGSADVTKVIPFVGLNFLIGGLFTVPQALISREMRYREISTAATLDLFVASISACILAWFGFGYWSLVFGEVAGALARGTMVSYYVRWRPRLRFSLDAFRELFSFGMGLYAKKIVDHAAQNVDNLVVGRLLGVTALGFYDKGFTACNKLYNKMTVVGPSVSFRIFSIIQDEPERFQRAYRKVVLSTTLVGYPVFAGLAVIAHPLFLVAFGEKWLPSVLPFQILCLAFALRLTNTYAGSAAQARGWIWSQVWRHGLNVLLIALGAYVLSPWGINGAAVAVLLATVLLWVLMQHLLRSATGFAWRDILEPQVPALICSAGIIAVALTAELIHARVAPEAPTWGILATQCAAGGLFYLGFLRFSGFREVSSLLAETLADISPKLARFVGGIA